IGRRLQLERGRVGVRTKDAKTGCGGCPDRLPPRHDGSVTHDEARTRVTRPLIGFREFKKPRGPELSSDLADRVVRRGAGYNKASEVSSVGFRIWVRHPTIQPPAPSYLLHPRSVTPITAAPADTYK